MGRRHESVCTPAFNTDGYTRYYKLLHTCVLCVWMDTSKLLTIPIFHHVHAKLTNPRLLAHFLACPKCVPGADSQLTCCGKGGAWEGTCTRHLDEEFDDYTWEEALRVCESTTWMELSTDGNNHLLACPNIFLEHESESPSGT